MRNFVKIVTRSTWFIALCCMLLSCEEHVDPNPPNTKPPNEIVSVGQAKQMFDSYSDRRIPIIKRYEETVVDTTQEFHPTRFGEYGYKTMKKYMAFIESEAALANVEIGGLRFYLTNYPNTSTFDDGSPVKYPRQNSFIIVPTTEVNGEQQGFITRTTTDGGRTIVLIKDWLQEQRQPEDQRNTKQGASKETGALNKQEGLGSLKPQFLFINPMTGTATPILDGVDISLILNEISLRPPPPDQDTDFD